MASAAGSLSKTLLRVAWFSILLGLGMEVLLLTVAAFFKHSMGTQAIIADLVQKVAWASIVCTGVAVGLGASRMRGPAMGLAGLIAAPIAFYIAKAAHKSVIQALSITPAAAAAGPSPMLLAGIKGAEYALLGYLAARLAKRASAGLREHALMGLFIGLTFGGLIVYLSVAMAADPLPLFAIISRCANEIIFPVGCAAVLYTAQKVGEKNAEDSEASSDPAVESAE